MFSRVSFRRDEEKNTRWIRELYLGMLLQESKKPWIRFYIRLWISALQCTTWLATKYPGIYHIPMQWWSKFVIAGEVWLWYHFILDSPRYVFFFCDGDRRLELKWYLPTLTTSISIDLTRWRPELPTIGAFLEWENFEEEDSLISLIMQAVLHYALEVR